jgi:putative transposase
MPEHVHLLLSEPERGLLSNAIQSLKIAVAVRAREVVGKQEPFWQRRYHDHNVRDHEAFVGKLRYIHRNPVERGLCANPEDWSWSSFRHYATGEVCGVEIESRWTAKRRELEGQR